MERYLLFVYTRPKPGQEAQFHRWYNQVHLGEVLRIPGFIAAERAASRSYAVPLTAGHEEFLAVYTIKTCDIAATLAAFEEARGSMTTTPALDPTSVRFELMRSLALRKRRRPANP